MPKRQRTSETRADHDVSLRLDLANGTRIGPGKIAVLEAIDTNGSISAAGRALGMSYRRTWALVEDMNQGLGTPVVAAAAGGSGGGGAELTEIGRAVIARYRAIESDSRTAALRHLASLEAAPVEPDALRPGEAVVAWPGAGDAALLYIGQIRTPWATRRDCPRRGSPDGPECRIEVEPLWREALRDIAVGHLLEIFYWLHRSRRDVVVQSPKMGPTRGTFSLRSPLRPNPIGTSVVAVQAIEGCTLVVRGLDCIDGTPLLDIKPERK